MHDYSGKEIKYKIWDRQEKHFLSLSDYSKLGAIHVARNGIIEFSSDYFFILNSMMQKDVFVILQYTGRNDRKNNEVYFGDICRYWDDSNTEQIGVVKDYGYSHAYIEAIGGDEEGNQDIDLHPDYDIEVIGNVFENPEMAEA